MTLPFLSLLGDGIFTFALGEEGRHVRVHTDVVTKLSPVLKALLTGPMREAKDKIAVWDDVEPEIFGLVCEYAYTGNYTPSEPWVESGDDLNIAYDHDFSLRWSDFCARCKCKEKNIKESTEVRVEGSEEEEGVNENVEGNVEEDSEENQIKCQWCRKASSALYNNFVDLIYDTPNQINNLHFNFYKHEDFTPVLLSHVGVYIFADKYNILDLRNLALWKLHHTLLGFELFPERIGDIVILVQEIFNNTMDKQDGSEPLRGLVVAFATAYHEELKDSNANLRKPQPAGGESYDGMTYSELLVTNHAFARDVYRTLKADEERLIPNFMPQIIQDYNNPVDW